MESARYDSIGEGYTKHRRAEPRIVDAIVRLLDLAPGSAVADVGAGSGNYARALADRGFRIHAVEPSAVMREQAPAHEGVEWHGGFAEGLPLETRSVVGVACILAMHHFALPEKAVSEMDRICGGGPIVALTCDPRLADRPWFADYFPAVWEESLSAFAPIEEVLGWFADVGRIASAEPLLVPHDLQDCFMAAGWRRPSMYLDPAVRRCMSGFALADQACVETGLARLAEDIADGTWEREHEQLREVEAIDWGYRFVIARPASIVPKR